ncbi:hypothetical protein, partial [Bacteroides timonensis]|uniref:hypothetical protein n=1 Tax=Bacteroides timonensis TaxID=1470345 RepID=UPI001ADEC45E
SAFSLIPDTVIIRCEPDSSFRIKQNFPDIFSIIKWRRCYFPSPEIQQYDALPSAAAQQGIFIPEIDIGNSKQAYACSVGHNDVAILIPQERKIITPAPVAYYALFC